MTKYLPAALMLAIFASPVTAQPPAAATSIVQTADLDLASKDGQRALDRRLSLAISDVCGTASDADLAGQNEVRRCKAETRQFVARDRDARIAAASDRPIEVAAR